MERGKRAALVHGWRLSYKGDGIIGQSERGELTTQATAIALLNDEFDIAVVNAGYLWGKQGPAIAELVFNVLTLKYGIDPNRIRADPNAYSTHQEFEHYLRTLQKENLEMAGSLAFNTHHWTINDLYRSRGITPRPISVDRILEQAGIPETVKRLRAILESEKERNYRYYQLGLRFISHTIDPRNRLLSSLAKGSRNRPSLATALPGFPIDHSVLPPKNMIW